MRHVLIAACQAALIFSPAFAQGGAHPPLRTMDGTHPPPHTITTRGEAVVKVAPDEVALRFDVDTRNKDMLLGKKAHEAKLKTITETAIHAGVFAKDIQTESFDIDAVYDRQTGEGVTGYQHRTTITTTLRDLGRLEALLTDMARSGACTAYFYFKTSQLQKCRDQALSMAIKAAKEKAMALTADFGQKVGRPNIIYEETPETEANDLPSLNAVGVRVNIRVTFDLE